MFVVSVISGAQLRWLITCRWKQAPCNAALTFKSVTLKQGSRPLSHLAATVHDIIQWDRHFSKPLTKEYSGNVSYLPWSDLLSTGLAVLCKFCVWFSTGVFLLGRGEPMAEWDGTKCTKPCVLAEPVSLWCIIWFLWCNKVIYKAVQLIFCHSVECADHRWTS